MGFGKEHDRDKVTFSLHRIKNTYSQHDCHCRMLTLITSCVVFTKFLQCKFLFFLLWKPEERHYGKPTLRRASPSCVGIDSVVGFFEFISAFCSTSCSKIFLCMSFLIPKNSHFPGISAFLYWSIVLKLVMRAYCYRSVIASTPSQMTEQQNMCVYYLCTCHNL